jgi:hypothetical protein
MIFRGLNSRGAGKKAEKVLALERYLLEKPSRVPKTIRRVKQVSSVNLVQFGIMN